MHSNAWMLVSGEHSADHPSTRERAHRLALREAGLGRTPLVARIIANIRSLSVARPSDPVASCCPA